MICKVYSSCRNMYKCHKTHVCVHLGNVCDNMIDCPHSDDEDLCQLHTFKCPLSCECLLLAIVCRKNFPKRSRIYPQIFLSVHSGEIHKFGFLQSLNFYFPQLIFFTALHSGIMCACQFNVKDLILVDLSFNSVSKLSHKCFHLLANLKVIRISSNKIETIHPLAFVDLVNIKLISLSNNPLAAFPDLCVSQHYQLEVLCINNISFSEIHQKLFHQLHITVVHATDFHICCATPAESFCSAQFPWHITCTNLLPAQSMRPIYIFVSFVVMLLNTTSVILTLAIKGKNTANSLNVAVVNLSDLLCAVYLSFVWVGDMITEGSFGWKEEVWRRRPTCFTAFGTSLWFACLAPGSLLFMSFARLRVVLSPMKTKFKHKDEVVKFLSIITATSLLLSLCVTFVVTFTEKMSPISLCLPFIDPFKLSFLTEMNTWCVSLWQLATSASMITMYVLLIKHVFASQKKIRKTVQSQNNRGLVIQIVVLLTSTVLCWFPMNLMYLSALFLPRYPMGLIFWAVCGILPLNSVTNPGVFILLTAKKTSLVQK